MSTTSETTDAPTITEAARRTLASRARNETDFRDLALMLGLITPTDTGSLVRCCPSDLESESFVPAVSA